MSEDYGRIYTVVRQHYAEIADEFHPQASPNGCCTANSEGQDCWCGNSLYEGQLLEALPPEVTGLSLGCGDPVTIAALEPGETVVDLGSGGGIDCFLAARQVGPDGLVIGVDATPAMLERARTNKAKLGAGNVVFRQGYIEALPVDDSSVDVVMSNCVINLSPDKPAVLREAFRVLKAGGRLAVTDIVTRGVLDTQIVQRLDLWSACIAGAIDVTQYERMLSDAGFEDIVVENRAEVPVEAIEGDCGTHFFSARITAAKPLREDA